MFLQRLRSNATRPLENCSSYPVAMLRSLWRKFTEGLGISTNEKIGMPFLAPDFAFWQAAGWLLILLAWPQARFRPSCSPIQSFCPMLPTAPQPYSLNPSTLLPKPSTLLPKPSPLLPAAKVATLCRPCQGLLGVWFRLSRHEPTAFSHTCCPLRTDSREGGVGQWHLCCDMEKSLPHRKNIEKSLQGIPKQITFAVYYFTNTPKAHF